MKTTFFYILSLFVLFSCKKQEVTTPENWQSISENVRFKDDGTIYQLKSGKFNYQFAQSKLPFKRVILLNASLLGYFTELGLEQSIIGISSPEYVYSNKVRNLVETGKIQNMGNEQKYDLEKIIALKPDAIFTNYISSFENTYDLIRKNGIEIIFLDEYLEQNPLEKSKYILVFGKLFNKEKLAEARFTEIKNNYQSLKKTAENSTKKPLVLANEMYGNQWFLPGGKTNLAQFIKDAHAQYIYADNTDSKAIPMSFEEVFAKSEKAEYWINIGNHRAKDELLQINPNYAKMKVYNEGKLYTLAGKETGKANDFFESGSVRADWVLKDYIKIFHPELFPAYKLTFMKELK